MKLKIRVLLLIILVLSLGSVPASAQTFSSRDSSILKKKESRGDKYFGNYSYSKAIKKYEGLIEDGYKSNSLMRNLAVSYIKIADTKRAEILFESIVKSNNYLPSDLYFYIQTLKCNQKYREADEWMERFVKEVPSDSRGILQQGSFPFVTGIRENVRYKIEIEPFNSLDSDFGAIDYDGDILFASNRQTQAIIRFQDARRQTPYYSLYRVRTDDASIVNARLFARKFNTLYNDGNMCLNSNSTELFVTRNNYRFRFPHRGHEGINNLKILYTQRSGTGTWSALRELPFDSNDYSCGHPTLAADGKTLFFSSDMPGGYGQTDIYYVTRTDSGWSHPVNIGKSINTEGDEMFPFISAEGFLYFSSDGRQGMGGLDLFIAQKLDSESYTVINMGVPLNSSADDFGIFLRKDSKTGFFSSNREGGLGDDDIYSFSVTDPVRFESAVGGAISDPISGGKVINSKNEPPVLIQKAVEYGIYGNVFVVGTPEIVPDVKIRLIKGLQDLVPDLVTHGTDNFRIKLEPNIDYQLVFSKPGFLTNRISYSTKGLEPGYVNINDFVNIALQKQELGAIIEIPNIYYDISKWLIRPDAAKELEKVIQFLMDNPTIRVELGSHTDSRGSDLSNETLSQKRAQSAVDFIVKRGIRIDRITAKGYGESKLKNRCGNGINCSEEEHQQNRRTEIRIIKL